jgi:AAA15 family ATPase/GTPase
MYSIFEETLTKPKMREWLDWDDENKISKNNTNQDRFFSWISEDEEYIDEDNEDVGYQIIEKIITKSSEIRELAKFINDEKALEAMEGTRMFSDAYIISDAIGKDKLDNSLSAIINHIDTAFKFSTHSTDQTRQRLIEIKNKLNGLMTAKGYSEILNNSNIQRELIFTKNDIHFTNIEIKQYKGILDLKINKINKINIFAGINNSGKSSLLEAIYLLGNGSDIFALFDIYRRRGKFCDKLDLLWFYENVEDIISLNANFNHCPIDLTIVKEDEDDDTIDKNKYFTSIINKFTYKDTTKTSKSRVYENTNETYFDKLYMLCNTTFSSPFSTQNKEDIIKYHEKSLETKSYQLIIDFLKEQLDTGIVNIQLGGELERFIVNHNSFDDGVDITSFGEGMQRIFYIALQFASSRDGILLIDELENGIHYSLLQDFTGFIQKLAEKFNVQVFITTHSSECIKSFISNNFKNEDISFSTIVKDKSNQIRTINYTSSELINELEQNSELRGW